MFSIAYTNLSCIRSSGVARAWVGDSPIRRAKMRKKMRKVRGNIRKNDGNLRKN